MTQDVKKNLGTKFTRKMNKIEKMLGDLTEHSPYVIRAISFNLNVPFLY